MKFEEKFGGGTGGAGVEIGLARKKRKSLSSIPPPANTPTPDDDDDGDDNPFMKTHILKQSQKHILQDQGILLLSDEYIVYGTRSPLHFY